MFSPYQRRVTMGKRDEWEKCEVKVEKQTSRNFFTMLS